MQKGTVKWFNPTKGYGFIRPSTGDKDVFVHISAVERAGLSTLNEGQVVEFELVSNRGHQRHQLWTSGQLRAVLQRHPDRLVDIDRKSTRLNSSHT